MYSHLKLVTHPTTNRAQHKVTLFMCQMMLTTMPRPRSSLVISSDGLRRTDCEPPVIDTWLRCCMCSQLRLMSSVLTLAPRLQSSSPSLIRLHHQLMSASVPHYASCQRQLSSSQQVWGITLLITAGMRNQTHSYLFCQWNSHHVM